MAKRVKKSKRRLPELIKIEICGETEDGELVARTVCEKHNPTGAEIFVQPNKRMKPALMPGDVVLAKLFYLHGVFSARPVTRLGGADDFVEKRYGVIEKHGEKALVVSAEKNSHETYWLNSGKGLKDGDFVSFFPEGDKRFKTARVIRVIGTFDLHKATSALVLDKYDIPSVFSNKANKEAKKLPAFDPSVRLDLTNLPFVTIDGDDSKDFDDAVWAEKTPAGFRLGVAIADVAFYVRDLSELDREAYKRGNSVYLPDMVVPMLPEVLSNDLCSLRPREKRPVLACFIEIDNDGKILNHNFHRAVIRSAERLTYGEVQDALDGNKNDKTAPLFYPVIMPLWEAYQALAKARKKRGALELETDEFNVRFDKAGAVKSVEKCPHLLSEKIVEEFMIAANVATAQTLKKRKVPVMYRIHDKPRAQRLPDLEGLLRELKMKLPSLPALKPGHFNKIAAACEKRGLQSGISDLILRMQSQAVYSPHNIGHFGLGLKDYVHFTSPIRRYADLLVHRALIKALKLPDGGALNERADDKLFEDIGAHISETERKAVNAEREMLSRYLAEYLKPAQGQVFDVVITGFSNAGIFVRIEEIGAEGLIFMKTLPNDRYVLPENKLSLFGVRSKREFRLGDRIKAMLRKANPVTGGLTFRFYDE